MNRRDFELKLGKDSWQHAEFLLNELEQSKGKVYFGEFTPEELRLALENIREEIEAQFQKIEALKEENFQLNKENERYRFRMARDANIQNSSLNLSFFYN